MNPHPKRSLVANAQSRGQRGIALMVCIFALLLLSGIAMGLMFMADTETIINENYRSSQQAFMAAAAGLEEVRERLMATSANPLPRPTAMPGFAAGGVLYVRNEVGGETVDPTDSGSAFFDEQLCKENFSQLKLSNTGSFVPCASVPAGDDWYTELDSSANYNAAALSYKWVRLTRKANNTRAPYCVQGAATADGSSCTTSPDTQVCWSGTRQVLLPAGWADCDVEPPAGEAFLRTVHILTSLAVTPTGARRMAQMEVAFHPPFITNAAVDSKAGVFFAGNPTVDGYDQCTCECKKTDKLLGKTICIEYADRPGKTCDRDKYAIYSEGAVGKPPGTVTAGTTPVVREKAPWIYDIPALVEIYANMPGAVHPFGTSCVADKCSGQGMTFGTLPNPFPPTDMDNPGGVPQITYVPGDLQLTAHSTGNGILVVDGDLNLHGGLQFYGLILVRGTFTFTGGGGDIGVHGAVLAGESSLVTAKEDETAIGGAANIYYDRCALARDFSNVPPTRLAFRELIN